MREAERILDTRGIVPHARVRVEQARRGQEEGWEYTGLVMQGEDAVAEVKKGSEVLHIAVGRLAAWQTKTPEQLRAPIERRDIYRDEGSARQYNATIEELRKGQQEDKR